MKKNLKDCSELSQDNWKEYAKVAETEIKNLTRALAFNREILNLCNSKIVIEKSNIEVKPIGVA